jgi:hypothetical protein
MSGSGIRREERATGVDLVQYPTAETEADIPL